MIISCLCAGEKSVKAMCVDLCFDKNMQNQSQWSKHVGVGLPKVVGRTTPMILQRCLRKRDLGGKKKRVDPFRKIDFFRLRCLMPNGANYVAACGQNVANICGFSVPNI